MKQKSILFIANNIHGLYSFRREIVQACIDNNYRVVISSPLENGPWNDFFEDLGCMLVNTEIDSRGTNLFKDFKLLCYYARLISKIKPNAVLSYTIKPNIYGGLACRLTGIKQIANITGLGDALESNGTLAKCLIQLYRIALKRCLVVFFQNESNLRFCLSNRIINGKYQLLPGSGVNLSYFAYSEYHITDTVVFGYVGRIMKQKGIDELFSAITIIKSRYGKKVEFHLLGNCDDQYVSQLEKMRKEDLVEFYGVNTDVRPFIKDIHCLVHPSYHEGMSNVCLECSAMGRPVITTDVPGCRETINDKETGYLIKPKDVDDLVSKIEKFIHLPIEDKRNMGIAARNKVEKEFNRDIVVEKYLSVLKDI